MQTRITITIPEELVKAADARAKALDRSRSWILVEALRQYLSALDSARTVREPTAPPLEDAKTRTPTPVDAAAEVAESRRHRLRAEMALPPLERLRRAEELARLGQSSPQRRAGAQVIGFDSYEDYYEWKKKRLIRP